MTIKGQSPSQRLNSNTSLALGKNNGAILIQDEEGTLGGINPPETEKSVLSFDGGLPNWKTLNELLEIPEPSASPAIFAIQNGAFVWIAPQAGPQGEPGQPGPQGPQGIPGPAQSGRALFEAEGNLENGVNSAQVAIQAANDGVSDALISFHVPNAIATNFGLNREDGWLEAGGWSYPRGGAPLRIGQLSITGGGGITFSDGSVQNIAIPLGGVNVPNEHWDGAYKYRFLGDWGATDGAILVHRALVADTANIANSTPNASGPAGNFTALGVIQSMLASEPQFQWHKAGVYGAVLKLDNTNWLSTQGWSAGGGFTSLRVGNLQVNGGLYFPDGSVQTTASAGALGDWVNVSLNNIPDSLLGPAPLNNRNNFRFRYRSNGIVTVIQVSVILRVPANTDSITLATGVSNANPYHLRQSLSLVGNCEELDTSRNGNQSYPCLFNISSGNLYIMTPRKATPFTYGFGLDTTIGVKIGDLSW